MQSLSSGLYKFTSDIPQITSTSSPSLDQHIVTKKYVDDAVANAGGGGTEPQYMVASLSAPINISTSNEPVKFDIVSRQSGEGYFSLDTTTGSIKVLKDCHVLVSASAFIVGITGNCSAYAAIYKNLTDIIFEYDGVLNGAGDNQFFHLTGPAQPLELKINDVLTLDVGYSGTRADFTSINQEKTVFDIWKDTTMIVEDLPSKRKYSFKAGVNIMYGCNNFCSYCIVPYVRGRERSRKPEDIIKEIKALVADGVVEVMLLGQNVNSYGKNLDEPMTFARLLQEVEKIEGLERIRFMTSHPKDLSDDLIEVMSKSTKICNHLHLPVQSGSTDILTKMNRKYTKDSYLDLVGRIKKAMPNISLTTDIIVGFPGETEEDFLDTLDVVKQVEYDSAYTFIYSKRTGTPAAAMDNQIPEDVVKDRFNRLLEVVQDISHKKAQVYEGTVQDVLVEEVNPQDNSLVTGRLSNNLLVHFPGNEEMIGKIVKVSLNECKGFYYFGELV